MISGWKKKAFLAFAMTGFAVTGGPWAAQAAGEQAVLTTAPMVPPPITRSKPATVIVDLEMSEKVGQLKHPLTGEAVDYMFWTFGGTVPGPFFRVRVGDTVEFHLKNSADSKNVHSIDLHSVNGQGGAAKLSQTLPGGQTGFAWKALNPGLYVYHCATPHIPTHVANGMYGLVLVQPEKGLPKVDREYYVMQGDFYPAGKRGDKGLQPFSKEKALAEQPEYILFNAFGSAGKMETKVGETVRLFVGNGGPNLTSAFHVIGEIFDVVYPEGAIGSEPHRNIQTTVVPPGGSAIVEMKINTKADYIIVDHAIFRAIDKGAVAILSAGGEENPDVLKVIKLGAPGGH
ncbi:MAG: nitrite reductase, copper-containing [Nitrospinae bacterium]|nr:nitrite reductase, copper-containing [Nitrospinota bacterium]